MSLSDAGELLALDYIGTQITHIGLCTADPGETGTAATEVSGGSYARVAVPAWHAASTAVGVSTMTNNGVIDFGTTTGAWGTITHWIGCSASSGSTVLFSGTITPNKTVGSGDSVTIPDASLTITAE
jgi:hypothetical protein